MSIRTGAEMRELARNRLIESRLTPNAISVTGLIGNVIAAVLILEHHFVLAGIAFILGSLCDMKSFKRLGIDPLAVYGTVFVKCPVHDTDDSAPACRARVLEEIAIVQPRIVVVMGEEALEELNDLHVPLGRQLEWMPGEIQRLTPAVEALTVPDIDRSLDDEDAKREFWGAFRALGEWYADFPPY